MPPPTWEQKLDDAMARLSDKLTATIEGAKGDIAVIKDSIEKLGADVKKEMADIRQGIAAVADDVTTLQVSIQNSSCYRSFYSDVYPIEYSSWYPKGHPCNTCSRDQRSEPLRRAVV